MDEPPKIGRTYTLNYSIEQTSFLGEVDRVVREDGPGPFLVTDGGRPEPAVLVARELHIPRAEAERLLSIQRSRRADDGE